MYIAVFLEITDGKEPKYFEAFEKRCRMAMDSENPVIASAEYVEKLSNGYSDSVIWEIPKEIMEKVDSSVENITDREILLQIQRNLELENWLKNKITNFENQDLVEGILVNSLYYSLKVAAADMGIDIFAASGKNSVSDSTDKDEFYQGKIELLENNLSVTEERYKNLQEAHYNLREYINSTENYMKNLQEHATKLDNSLKEAIAARDDAEYRAKELDRIKEENQVTLDLYKKVLKELDERKVEVLELKSRKR